MTDKQKTTLDVDASGALNLEDEQLLQNFFAGFKEEIPDDGFSEKVMNRLPDTSRRRLERWWQVACVVVGAAFLCSSQVLGNLQDLLFASKIDMMLQFSRAVCHLGEVLGQSHSLLVALAGMLTVACVWGYNEILDARLG